MSKDPAHTQNLYIYADNNPPRKIDVMGLKAWDSTRKIQPGDRYDYRNWIRSNYTKWINIPHDPDWANGSGTGKDCADFAMWILTEYAIEKKLGIVLKAGSNTYDSDSNDYSTIKGYRSDIWINIGAINMPGDNSKKLKYVWKSATAGDLLMFNQPSWDTNTVVRRGRDKTGKRYRYFRVLHKNPEEETKYIKYYVRKVKKRMYLERPWRWKWQSE